MASPGFRKNQAGHPTDTTQRSATFTGIVPSIIATLSYNCCFLLLSAPLSARIAIFIFRVQTRLLRVQPSRGSGTPSSPLSARIAIFMFGVLTWLLSILKNTSLTVNYRAFWPLMSFLFSRVKLKGAPRLDEIDNFDFAWISCACKISKSIVSSRQSVSFGVFGKNPRIKNEHHARAKQCF